MPKSADEFGITCRKWIPFGWRTQPDNARTSERAASLNQANEKRLQTLLEYETRERPSGEIANLEALLIEVLHCVKQVPGSRTVLLAAQNMEWVETSQRVKPTVGERGLVTVHLDADMPHAVEFFADISFVGGVSGDRQIRAELMSRSDRVVDLYQQLIFIYHRRAQRDKADLQ